MALSNWAFQLQSLIWMLSLTFLTIKIRTSGPQKRKKVDLMYWAQNFAEQSYSQRLFHIGTAGNEKIVDSEWQNNVLHNQVRTVMLIY